MVFVKTQSGASPIIVKAHLPAPPADVFRAWTDPESVKKWFGYTPGSLSSAEVDLRPGGRWRFVEHVGPDSLTGFEGEYLKVEPNKLLVFTWSKIATNSTGATDTVEHSRVEIQLSDTDAGTEMTIVHSALDDLDSRTNFAAGWEAGVTHLLAYIRSV